MWTLNVVNGTESTANDAYTRSYREPDSLAMLNSIHGRLPCAHRWHSHSWWSDAINLHKTRENQTPCADNNRACCHRICFCAVLKKL